MKELPGIAVGSIGEQDQPTGIVIFTNGQSSWQVRPQDLTRHPDIYERVDDKPEDETVFNEDGTLSTILRFDCELPRQVVSYFNCPECGREMSLDMAIIDNGGAS